MLLSSAPPYILALRDSVNVIRDVIAIAKRYFCIALHINVIGIGDDDLLFEFSALYLLKRDQLQILLWAAFGCTSLTNLVIIAKNMFIAGGVGHIIILEISVIYSATARIVGAGIGIYHSRVLAIGTVKKPGMRKALYIPLAKPRKLIFVNPCHNFIPYFEVGFFQSANRS